MEETNSSFETGADDSSADPPAEIRPLVLLLAGDIDAGHEHADEDADETSSTSSSAASTSSSQPKEESRAKLEEEMGQAIDALQRSEEARVHVLLPRAAAGAHRAAAGAGRTARRTGPQSAAAWWPRLCEWWTGPRTWRLVCCEGSDACHLIGIHARSGTRTRRGRTEPGRRLWIRRCAWRHR